MKKSVLILILILTTGMCCAQIPRMLNEPWYKALKTAHKSQPMVEEPMAAQADHDVVGEMREAYNNREWQRVDSLFELACKEAPDHAQIYNWERASLRRQMQENENVPYYMNRLMSLYQQRMMTNLPVDMPYHYGNNSQWNDVQRLVDYTVYAGRRIDTHTQYEFLIEQLAKLDKPYNAIVLCHLMDVSVADGQLQDEEFLSRYEMLVKEAHTTRDWLNNNFLSMNTKTASDMLQALEQREVMMRHDARVQAAINLAMEEAEDERLRTSSSMEERAQYYLRQAGRYLANQEYEKAVQQLRISLDHNKDNPVAYLRLAECYTANSKVTGRVGNFLDKYYNQFAAIAAIDMLRENLHYVQSQQGRSALTTQIEELRAYVNRNPIYRQDLFRLSMGFGDTVRLGSYIRRTITMKERY